MYLNGDFDKIRDNIRLIGGGSKDAVKRRFATVHPTYLRLVSSSMFKRWEPKNRGVEYELARQTGVDPKWIFKYTNALYSQALMGNIALRHWDPATAEKVDEFKAEKVRKALDRQMQTAGVALKPVSGALGKVALLAAIGAGVYFTAPMWLSRMRKAATRKPRKGS